MSDPRASERSLNNKWFIMVAVSFGTFMATLDSSIVNISMPNITGSLHTDLAAAQWVVTVYLLVITGLLLTLGRLADLIGRKNIFITGFAIFTVGSLLCGISRSIHLLIAFRALQGIGAAMIMSNGPAILAHTFPATERGKAMGLLGTVVAVGLTLGPALGGLLISVSGWPLIFFVNLPVGVIGILIAKIVLPADHRDFESHFDIPGAAMLLVSLVSMTLALSEGPARGWGSPFIVGLFAASAIVLALFIQKERKTAYPLLDLELFKNRLFAAASVSAFISYMSMFFLFFLTPFYMADVLKYDPRTMGITLTAVSLTVGLIAPISGMLSDKIGSRLIGSIGLGIMSLGLLLVSRLGETPTHAHVIWALIVIGLGSGIFQSPNNSAIMGSVPPRMLGVAAGMMATMRNLGMVTGVAVSAAIYESHRIYYVHQFSNLQASQMAFHSTLTVAAAICAVGIIASAAKGTHSQG